MNKEMTAKFAPVILLITAIIWGTGFIGSQIALDLGFTPMHIIGVRMVIASIMLDVFFFKRLKIIKKEEIKAGVIIGSCLLAGFIFQMFGLQYSTPSINGFLTAVYVVLIPFIKFLMTKQRVDIYANAGAVLTVIGIGFISLTGGGFQISLGAWLTLICAVFYAFQLIFTEKFTKDFDPIHLTIVMINFAALVSFSICIISAILFKDVPPVTLKGISSFIYLGAACTFVCFLTQNIGQKHTPAVQAAIILSLESVFCAIFSAMFFKEEFTLQMLFGCLLIFAAIIISETKLSFLRKPEKTKRFSEEV